MHSLNTFATCKLKGYNKIAALIGRYLGFSILSLFSDLNFQNISCGAGMYLWKINIITQTVSANATSDVITCANAPDSPRATNIIFSTSVELLFIHEYDAA